MRKREGGNVAVTLVGPVDPQRWVLGASSDYLVFDATAAAGHIRVGGVLVFWLDETVCRK